MKSENKGRVQWKRRAASCMLAFLSISSYAQEILLDPVTVTSSMMEKRASETGRNIQIVKGEYFNRLPVNSLDELLRYVPGVEVQARGPMGSQSDLVLRGGTFQQVLVILDGLRLNDPNTGHFNSNIPIVPSEIERIEVLKGASSAIYGSEAVGGVIHIISKSFASRGSSTDSSEVDASAGAGQFGLWTGRAGATLRTGKLTVSGGGLINRADGVQQRGTNGHFDNRTLSLSGKYAINSAWNIAGRVAYDDRDFSAQNFYTTLTSDTASERIRTSWNQLSIRHEKGRSAFSVEGGFKRVSDQYLFNPVAQRNESISKLWQGLAVWKQSFSNYTELVGGVNYQNKSIASNDRGEHSRHQLAPFLSLSHRIGRYFTFSPAIRLDWRENLGAEFVPQASISYRRGEVQLRGSAGKTIRDADFTERFNNYGKVLVTGGSVGNPALKAERSFSYETGIDWFPLQGLKLSSTFFQRFHRDLIDFSVTPYAEMPRKDNLSSMGTFALAKNISEVNTTGAEADVQFIHAFGNNRRLFFNFGLTWLQSKSTSATPSFYVSSHAKLLANFSAIYQVSRFSVSVNGLHKTREPREATAIQTAVTAQYFVMNLKADFAVVRDVLSVYVQADNLFDKKYSDLLGAPMPGRWLMGGIKLHPRFF